MADITYCVNSDCPFKDCERHLSKISKACIKGKGYVSVANFDGICRRYISHIVNEHTQKDMTKIEHSSLCETETFKGGDCPLEYLSDECMGYRSVLLNVAFGLINRQKAEIERLQAMVEREREKYEITMDKLKETLEERADHSEAIKEFAERLKKLPSVLNCESEWMCLDIDNLLKEMVGE